MGHQLSALKGIRILDFTHVLAGPFCTRVLADMGADVVKVNSESRAQINAPVGPYFTLWNRNKRTVSLDMNRTEAREIGLKLAQQADVVIDNFSHGVLESWDMGYKQVCMTNPKVIYVQMSGMGSGGPWTDFVTYAPTIHALAGLTYTTGVPGRSDIGIGFSYNDHVAGLHAAVAILAAIESRDQTNKGQKIDISQFEVAVSLLGPTLMDYFANGIAAEPCSNDLPYDEHAPHGCYRCVDKKFEEGDQESWIAIACIDDEQWEALCNAMGDPDWTQDVKFGSGRGRYLHRRSLDQRISEWTCTKDARQLMYELQSSGVPAGVVQDGIDLMERDPQLELSQFIRKMEGEHPTMGFMYGDRLPIDFEKTPCETYNRSRTLGEDNEAVLLEWLGLDAQTVRNGEESGFLK